MPPDYPDASGIRRHGDQADSSVGPVRSIRLPTFCLRGVISIVRNRALIADRSGDDGQRGISRTNPLGVGWFRRWLAFAR